MNSFINTVDYSLTDKAQTSNIREVSGLIEDMRDKVNGYVLLRLVFLSAAGLSTVSAIFKT